MRKDADGVLVPAWFITDVKAEHQGRTCQMVCAIPGDVKMHSKPVGRGYAHLREDQAHPWPRPNMPVKQIRAHEFHYSSLENLPADSRFAYHVERGYGMDGERDGLVLYNLPASYTHLRTIGSCYWATRFVAFIRQVKINAEPVLAAI